MDAGQSGENENMGSIAVVQVIIMMRDVVLTEVLHGSGNFQRGCTIETMMD